MLLLTGTDMDPNQLKQATDMMGNMSEDQMMNMMTYAQKAQTGWAWFNWAMTPLYWVKAKTFDFIPTHTSR